MKLREVFKRNYFNLTIKNIVQPTSIKNICLEENIINLANNPIPSDIPKNIINQTLVFSPFTSYSSSVKVIL